MTDYRAAAISAEDVCQYLCRADFADGIDEGEAAKNERRARAEFVKLANVLGYVVTPEAKVVA
jgi:hypothetical protein